MLLKQNPRDKRASAILPIILLVVLLLLALIFIFPQLLSPTPPPSQRLTSFDWSGYSISSDLKNPKPVATSVSASWIVPTVNVSSTDSFNAAWIGIGGQFDETLIQAGTEHDSINGQAAYAAWYELLPSDSVNIDSLSVSPGDTVTSTIFLSDPNTNTWTIEVLDVTDGQAFRENFTYNSSMLTCEWIVERPNVNNRVSVLSNFGQITFTNCHATLGGVSGKIGDFPNSQFTIFNRQNVELVSVTPMTTDGSSFTVDYID